eukprot:c9762_g1_i1 orf=606-2351(-)
MAAMAAGPPLSQAPPCIPVNNTMPASFMHSSDSLTMALTPHTGMTYSSVYPLPSSLEPASCLSRIKLTEILPEDGAASSEYAKAVEDLWGCLARHGAAIVELSAEDAALVRCALESAKLYFRTRVLSSSSSPAASQQSSKFAGYTASGSKEMYHYRAGRNLLGEGEHPPPCMSDVYRCLGKASRIVLGAICRQLQLRSDVFCSLLDDCPLPREDTSSSVLLATNFRNPTPSVNGTLGVEGRSQDFEKGLITLIASDSPGLQVCDTNGLWYLADIGLRAGDLLLVTGKALQHITAGLCRACAYRVMPLSPSSVPGSSRRISLMFRLMPRSRALLDGSAMAETGHVVSEGFGPVLVSKFMESLSTQEAVEGTRAEKSERKRYVSSDSALRSLLCDPMTGDLLEDAYTAIDCGHTFGGGTLKRVRETQACSSCGAAVNVESMVPNLVLRAVAVAFDREEKRRRLQVASRKRRKELREQRERKKRLKESKTPRKSHESSEQGKGVQYPFNVNEKVLIKGNKRTPEKLVGREAFVTSKCLNGWYLLKLVDNGESVRLQYRSLEGMGDCDGAAGDALQHQSLDNAEA